MQSLRDLFSEQKVNRKKVAIELDPYGLKVAIVDSDERAVVEITEYSAGNRRAYGIGHFEQDLANLVATFELRSASAALLLHPAYYQIYAVERPEVDRDEYRKAVRWQLRDIVNMKVDEMQVDIFGDDLENAKRIYAVVANKVQLQEFVSVIGQNELKTELIDIYDFSLKNLITALCGDQGAFCSLQIDNDYYVISVIQDGNLRFTRRVPNDEDITSSNFIAKLAQELQRSLDYAQFEFNLTRPDRLIIYVSPELMSLIDVEQINAATGLLTSFMRVNSRNRQRLRLGGTVDDESCTRNLALIGTANRLLG